ncbi:MAG: hypothetical protein BWK73_40480 [Thiothrix lacustris]|uniref:Uncharacterized protein n=1 Tax=Thiothrix lacustris TaxID=525917 RepID=A0A1Y1QDM2_9GAMM|nr:MAG: hypothetical protein BWK73_40480 [Thiothrix lacustris]
MEAEAATAAAGSNSTLAAIGNSLTNMGTAAKVFALSHPMGMAVVGGALLGLGTYYAFGKMFGKKKVSEPVMAAA